MKLFDTKRLLLENVDLDDEQFERLNSVSIIASVLFMIAGPLFMYYGFYLLTWPYTVKSGALFIAIGLLILLFGFSLWQDRQMETLRRTHMKETAEIRHLITKMQEKKD